MDRLCGQNWRPNNKPLWWILEGHRGTSSPPPLPAMDEPAVYVLHPDVMQVNTRKNYVRDRMRAALIYISEYVETKCMMTEGRYNNEELLVRLRAVFGCVNQVRDHIDRALQQDDAHHRKKDMRFLTLPTHFPRPESMGQGDIAIWTNWIREETDEITKQLEEERDSRSDPDDPFNGTANGVFLPLQDPLSLPRAKSAFVVPMGKWQFKRTPFGLSQAPAYFQLLINKVLMGCSSFVMGYPDDIIIFSKTEEEHLQHLEEIFVRLCNFGLKMKHEKCSFFKKHIQYLGHLVSEKGFEPLLEKLESIRNIPAPRTAKEVKQFFRLIGYYRKFVPRFADISRPLTKLTHHNVVFEWTDQCAKAFNHLCELLMEYPILRYPNPTQGYILYTDASGIGWSGVLTQEHLDKKGKAKNHPICYGSGQFRGSQLNWAALTKEAYVIYMSVWRLSFYVTDAEVTIRSDHLPLKKFLNKQTMNSKVNNWAVELEQFQLHLEWIPGTRNSLADSLSRLLDVVPDAQKTKEPDNQEFGSYCFEELEPAKVMERISMEVIELTDSSEYLNDSQES